MLIDVEIRDMTNDGWLDALAGRQPTPGGGAAAALSAATAAALIGMVAKYTTGGKWADREARMHEIDSEATGLRLSALSLADEDGNAFGAVGSAYGLPRNSEEEKATRTGAIQAALIEAAKPPVAVGKLAARIVTLSEELAAAGNPNVVSDVAVASTMARAALEGAIVNISINRKSIRDDNERDKLDLITKELEGATTAADAVTNLVREKVQ